MGRIAVQGGILIMRGIISFAAAIAALLGATPAFSAKVELPVPVSYQQTQVWCWAATASMALQFYGYPNVNPAGNYQCGIVGVALPECTADCRQCIRPIGPLPNMVTVIRRYQAYVRQNYGSRFPALQPRYQAYPTFEQLKAAVNATAPVIVGISPSGPPANPAFTQHAVLVTGYDEFVNASGQRVRVVILNDPLIYPPGQNPHVLAGGVVSQQSGKVMILWEHLRDRLNLTSAVFLRG
jgi:hypothetical protein